MLKSGWWSEVYEGFALLKYKLMKMQIYLPNKGPSTDFFFLFEWYIGGFVYSVMEIIAILDRLMDIGRPF